MAKKFPIDEFDSAAIHGGRHRARRTAKDRIFEWVRLFVIAAVVSAVGYGGLKIVEGSSVFDGYLPGSNPSASASVQALPGVAVLDGGGAELAAPAAEILKEAGFNVTGASVLVDAQKKPVAIETTVIVITDELFRADAESIAVQLGSPEVIVSPEFAGPITVVLGADYKLPAE
jgi:hypothetical protein